MPTTAAPDTRDVSHGAQGVPPVEQDHCGWDFTACFVGDGLIVNKLIGYDERLATIDLKAEVQDLHEQEQGWLIPAARGTWLAATQTTIRRCRLTRRQDL